MLPIPIFDILCVDFPGISTLDKAWGYHRLYYF